MELIELETAIEIAREYLYMLKNGYSAEDASIEMASEMRNKKYDIEDEEDYWQYEEMSEEQLKMIRYMVYHDYEQLTKGDANRIIRILKHSAED